MNVSAFAHSANGVKFVGMLERPGVATALLNAARMQRPAIEVFDQSVADEIGMLTHPERKAAGRLVRLRSRDLGLVPWKKGQRVRNGRAFATGTVYREIAPPPAADERASAQPVPVGPVETALASSRDTRIDAAIAILEAGRDATKPRDTVDAFLRDRRAMWGKG